MAVQDTCLVVLTSVPGKRTILSPLSCPGVWRPGAQQWLNMLTELRNRGVADVLIVCCDEAEGLPDTVWRYDGTAWHPLPSHPGDQGSR